MKPLSEAFSAMSLHDGKDTTSRSRFLIRPANNNKSQTVTKTRQAWHEIDMVCFVADLFVSELAGYSIHCKFNAKSHYSLDELEFFLFSE